eukprot:jgi/Psemu1/15976/gm1.15976_g
MHYCFRHQIHFQTTRSETVASGSTDSGVIGAFLLFGTKPIAGGGRVFGDETCVGLGAKYAGRSIRHPRRDHRRNLKTHTETIESPFKKQKRRSKSMQIDPDPYTDLELQVAHLSDLIVRLVGAFQRTTPEAQRPAVALGTVEMGDIYFRSKMDEAAPIFGKDINKSGSRNFRILLHLKIANDTWDDGQQSGSSTQGDALLGSHDSGWAASDSGMLHTILPVVNNLSTGCLVVTKLTLLKGEGCENIKGSYVGQHDMTNASCRLKGNGSLLLAVQELDDVLMDNSRRDEMAQHQKPERWFGVRVLKMNFVTKHVPLMLASRFKQVNGEKTFRQPRAFITKEGVEVGIWFQRAIECLELQGMCSDPFFRSTKGKCACIRKLDVRLRSTLSAVQLKWPNSVGDDEKLGGCSMRRSPMRGATAEAQNSGILEEMIEANNCWRKQFRSRGPSKEEHSVRCGLDKAEKNWFELCRFGF